MLRMYSSEMKKHSCIKFFFYCWFLPQMGNFKMFEAIKIICSVHSFFLLKVCSKIFHDFLGEILDLDFM